MFASRRNYYGTMELVTLWMAVGFLFAAYSVIANDSVQTLGTWIASNNEEI